MIFLLEIRFENRRTGNEWDFFLRSEGTVSTGKEGDE